jgi:NTE family protein
MAAVLSHSPPPDTGSPEVTLVIGSGGIRCAAALGVVRALTDAGIGVERVVGCSTGAIFAALVAFGYSAEESKAVAMRLWPRELGSRRNPLGLLRAVAPRVFGSSDVGLGLGDERPPSRLLASAFGGKRLEEAARPLHVIACDFMTGDLVELVSGPLGEGLCASLSLPPAFTPQRLGDRLLVDGSLADPLPVSVAIKHGARVIVAVGFEHPHAEKVGRAGRVASRLNAILANNLLRAKLAFHSAAHHAEMIVIFPEFRHRAGRPGKDNLAWIIGEGEQAALQQMPYLHHLLAAERVQAAA